MERLRVTIPDLDLPNLDEFLKAHPEMGARLAELRQQDRQTRDLAEQAIEEIHGHFTTGAPSRFGLCVTLRSLLRLLDEDPSRPDQQTTDRREQLTAAMDQVRGWIELSPSQRDPKYHMRRVLDDVDDLLDDFDDLLGHVAASDRNTEREKDRARAAAFREAAELLRLGASHVQLARLAERAQPPGPTLQELAAELGIALPPEEDKEKGK